MNKNDTVSDTSAGYHACPKCAFASPPGYRYCGQCGTALGNARRHSQTPERRQLTVLFCDLAGSTQIAARVDPEDFRDVVMSFQSVCTAIIPRYGGNVSRYMGDGILALSGYPVAREDDAESAVRAG